MRTATASIALALALASTMVFAQNVTYDYDRTADFSRFKRYAWTRGTIVPDTFNHERISAAINAQLAAQGMIEVDPTADPDVLVAYHANFDRDLRVTGFASGWGGFRYGGTRSGVARTEEILVGTLAVDIVDASSRTIVWRGMAVKDVKVAASPDKRDASINRAVEKIFKNYPRKSSR
jgi:hypothetical protein